MFVASALPSHLHGLRRLPHTAWRHESSAVQGDDRRFTSGNYPGEKIQVSQAHIRPEHGLCVLVGSCRVCIWNVESLRNRNAASAMALLSPNGTSRPRPSARTSSAYR